MSEKISVLVVDDSLVFRRLLRDLLESFPGVEIIAEAQNGIDALDQILRNAPDVILMDFEMPLMDGMTALQHLMVHRPTPTILLSSLTAEGTIRSYDTLKNGAVDFICKDFFFEEESYTNINEILFEKIQGAAGMSIAPQTAFSPSFLADKQVKHAAEKVVFCEDCGNREVVDESEYGADHVLCSRCGDQIFLYTEDSRVVANNSLTVFVGGLGSFKNLLSLVPEFDTNYTGSFICVLDAPEDHVDSFTEYLGSIALLPVHRASVNTAIEGGACYVFARSEQLCLKPYSASVKLQKLPDLVTGIGPTDVMLASAAKIFKERSRAVILSGKGDDGIKGLGQMQKVGGAIYPLQSDLCLYKESSENTCQKFSLSQLNEQDVVEELLEETREIDFTRID